MRRAVRLVLMAMVESNPSVARDALGVKLGHRRVRNYHVARLAGGNPSVNTIHDRNYKDESPMLEV